jgi:hypothetical protein
MKKSSVAARRIVEQIETLTRNVVGTPATPQNVALMTHLVSTKALLLSALKENWFREKH